MRAHARTCTALYTHAFMVGRREIESTSKIKGRDLKMKNVIFMYLQSFHTGSYLSYLGTMGYKTRKEH